MLATTVAVAVVVHAVVPEIGWPAAFALGAIVSPPDAVAAVAVLRRLSVPRRLVTLLEGESLFNDATALVAFRVRRRRDGDSLVLLARRRRSSFVFVGIGGILVGIVVGAVIALLRQPPDRPARRDHRSRC